MQTKSSLEWQSCFYSVKRDHFLSFSSVQDSDENQWDASHQAILRSLKKTYSRNPIEYLHHN